MDRDVDSSRQVQFFQFVDSLHVWLDNIDQPLVGADFNLIHRFLVDVRRTINCVFFYSGRQWNGAAYSGSGAFSSIYDIGCRLIDHSVIVAFELYPYALTWHERFLSRRLRLGASRRPAAFFNNFLQQTVGYLFKM